MLVDDAAILVDHLDRDDALGGGLRDAQAGVHVLGDAGGGATQGDQRFTGDRTMFGRLNSQGFGGMRARLRSVAGRSAVGLEYLFPAIVDRPAVTQVLLVQLVFEPAVDSKFGWA